jgi:quinohemoprotein ethanol dehydrogenase
MIRLPSLWVAALCTCAATINAADNIGSTSNNAGASSNWIHHGGGTDETGYSQLSQISTANISKLGLSWAMELPGEVTLAGTPLAVNGVLYFTGSYAAVYAVNAASGKLLWKFDPQTWKDYPQKLGAGTANNFGAAYAYGRVYFAAMDGRLFALNAKTGKKIWSVETVDSRSGQAVKGAPRVFNDKVIIGHTGADLGLRGYVTAYDAATGKQRWRFYTAPGTPEENRGDPAMERAASTWTGEYWKSGTGGAVWDGMTFDAEFNRIYLGTANAGPYDPKTRSPGGGDNLYTASIVALDADTGKYVWHYQINPKDAWDYDCTQGILLATLTINGQPRKVLMQAPKNGFYYVIDRESGKLISAEKIGKVSWADHIDINTGRPVENANIRYETGLSEIWPSTYGAHSWQAMSYSPRTGLAYIPYMQSGTRFGKGGAPLPGDVSFGGLNIGTAVTADPLDNKGALLAWDPVRQRAAWKVQHDTLWNGGTLATAGGLVFQGAADGYFSAYDATNGNRLWRFNAGLGVLAAPISYKVGSKQYVSVLVGYGGNAAIASDIMNVGWKYGQQPRRLLTFALNGKAILPPSSLATMTVKALDDPALELKPFDVTVGKAIYLACAACHGRDLVSAGAPAPDLRESALALNPDTYWSVVHDGVLMSRGMPKFEGFTRTQLMAVYAYIRAGARQVLADRKAEVKSAPATR